MSESDRSQAISDERLGELYRDSAAEQPGAHMDSLILRAAREAADRPVSRWQGLFDNWYVPVSVAAVLGLSVTLVSVLQTEHDVLDLEHELPESSALDSAIQDLPVASEAGEAATDAPDTHKDDKAERSMPALIGEGKRQDSALSERAGAADFMAGVTTGSAAPQTDKVLAKPASPEMREKETAAEARTEPAAELQSLQRGFTDESREQLAPAGALNLEANEIQAQLEQVTTPESDPAPARAYKKAKSSVAPAPASVVAGEHADLPEVFDSTVPEQSRERASQLRKKPAAAAVTGGLAAFSEDAPGEFETKWLESILKLFESGDNKAAIDELKRFKRAYPDYPESQIRQTLGDFLQ